jgi:hypothetical protein
MILRILESVGDLAFRCTGFRALVTGLGGKANDLFRFVSRS